MKKKNAFLAAAVTGALVSLPMNAHAGTPTGSKDAKMEKSNCNGKAAPADDKASCSGTAEQGKKDSKAVAKEKVTCAGKSGCGAR